MADKKKNKQLNWIVAILIIALFALTAPKTVEDYGVSRGFYKVDNYFLFSTLSASYKGGTSWKVHQIGLLGMKFKIK